ncbi:unnamed protein product [Discula destructiva]
MLPLDASVVTAAAVGSSHEQVYTDATAYNDGQWGLFPSAQFHSVNAQVPTLLVNTWEKVTLAQESHIFIQHDIPSHQSLRAGGQYLGSSPLILDADDLTTVYLNRSFPGVANVNVQEYDGKPVLTFYGGQLDTDRRDVGSGWIWLYDQNYQQVGGVLAEKLDVGAGAQDFIMTGPKTAILTAYQSIDWNLGAYSGNVNATDGIVQDSLFQEIDLDTLEVLFEWRASEHISPDMSFQPVGDEMFQPNLGWDYFHLTSVQKSQEGNYLISGAHTHSIYSIDGITGDVRWTLGGKGNEFQELSYPEGRSFSEPLLSMAWQHHARFYPGNEREITLFDNHDGSGGTGSGSCADNCSRGLHFTLDPDAKKVQLLEEYVHPSGLSSLSGGSIQVLANGNVFIGWGSNPAITEHAANGTCVFDMQFSPWSSAATGWQSLGSYRAFKADWSGTPTAWMPAIVVDIDRTTGDLMAWMSWNGATGVRGWALLASNKPYDLNGAEKVVAWSDREGFETKMWVQGVWQRYLRAVALGEHGVILGASGVYDTRRKKVTSVEYPVTEVEKHETPAEAAQHDEELDGKGKETSHFGIPKLTYHETMTIDRSLTGMSLQFVGVVLGVWVFSRLF